MCSGFTRSPKISCGCRRRDRCGRAEAGWALRIACPLVFYLPSRVPRRDLTVPTRLSALHVPNRRLWHGGSPAPTWWNLIREPVEAHHDQPCQRPEADNHGNSHAPVLQRKTTFSPSRESTSAGEERSGLADDSELDQPALISLETAESKPSSSSSSSSLANAEGAMAVEAF